MKLITLRLSQAGVPVKCAMMVPSVPTWSSAVPCWTGARKISSLAGRWETGRVQISDPLAAPFRLTMPPARAHRAAPAPLFRRGQ
jgi:hypothetical protein